MTESTVSKFPHPSPRDREIMGRPVEWPLRPILPVRRYHTKDDGFDYGVLVEGMGPKVYRVAWNDALFRGLDEEAEVDEYGSLNLLCQDDWLVD